MSAIINTLRATVQAVPDSWEARLGLVEALLNEGRRGEAVEVLQEISELPAGLDERIKAGRAWGLLDPESGLEVISGILEEQPPHAAAHLEKARICRRIGDLAMARTRKRDRVTSLTIALGVLGLICVLLTLIVIARPSPAPPMITASVIPALDEDRARQEIQRPQLQRRPASLGSPPLDVVSLAAASPVTMPDLDASALGTGMVGIDAGMGLGPSMDFGSPGDGVSFMGFKTRGDLAVVFDITNSMYAATPVVVVEIQRAYRNARVVCVFGGGFKREEFSGLIPYRENEKVRAIVNHYAEGEITEKLNKALFSLKRCISLEVDHAGDFRQSVGAGIEALLGQSNPPGTIFVFSDFEDGVQPDYMDEIKRLVQRKGTKVVFWYPFEKGSRKWNAVREQYEAFAKATQGELKEEAIK